MKEKDKYNENRSELNMLESTELAIRQLGISLIRNFPLYLTIYKHE